VAGIAFPGVIAGPLDLVIAGLDPAIHDGLQYRKSFERIALSKRFMDARVEPGHDRAEM
jgi:hypothetical protein